MWKDLYFHDLIFKIKNPACVCVHAPMHVCNFIVHLCINIENI